MNGKSTAFATGLGLGAALAYLFDRERGARHRALARDRLVHLYHVTPAFAAKAGRDLGNRAQGFASEARASVNHDDVPDHILVERVRAKLGRFVSHPGSIDVTAREGMVTLAGPILRHEVDPMLKAVAGVRGVEYVENNLTVYADGASVPGLQGGVPRPGDDVEWRQQRWSPGTRLISVMGGGALGYAGARMRGIPGAVAGLTGALLAVRGFANLPLGRLVGLDGSPRVIEVHKSVNIQAPVEEVFRFWADFEDYPRFMQHVEEVRRLDDGRLHWRVTGPAGASVAWDAEITELVENETIAWRTDNGNALRQAGRVRFIDNGDGTTRVDIHLSYCPPAGALGHMVATMFGVDPKHSMEQDLVRFQSLFHTGKTTAHGQTVTRDEIEAHLDAAGDANGLSRASETSRAT